MARGTFTTLKCFGRNGAVKNTPPMTFSLWVNASAFSTTQCVASLCFTNSITYGFDVTINTSGTPCVRARNNITHTNFLNAAYAASNLSANTWSHIAGVIASATSRTCYLDGVAGTTSTASVTPTYPPTRTGIGALYTGAASAYIPCTYTTIAEAAIYDVALTADEVAQLADGYSPSLVRPWDLLAYWPLVRGDGSGNELDNIGGNTLTETDTVGVQTHAPKMILPRKSQRYWLYVAPPFSPSWVRSSQIISAGVQHA